MIRIDNITKTINNNKILNNITINFRPHELVCILGQSGSGKTTLLNLIGNNDTPTTGNIYLGKTNIKNISISNIIKINKWNAHFKSIIKRIILK